MLRRLLLMGLACLPVLLAAPASAKFPPFTIEVSSNDSVVGEPLEITVRLWNDIEHTQRARWPDVRRLNGLLSAVPYNGRALSRDSGAISIDLRRVRPGVFRGEIVFPRPGRWALCPWDSSPCRRVGPVGYPGRVELQVWPPTPTPRLAILSVPLEASSIVPMTVMAFLLLVSLLWMVLRRPLERRRPR